MLTVDSWVSACYGLPVEEGLSGVIQEVLEDSYVVEFDRWGEKKTLTVKKGDVVCYTCDGTGSIVVEVGCGCCHNIEPCEECQ